MEMQQLLDQLREEPGEDAEVGAKFELFEEYMKTVEKMRDENLRTYHYLHGLLTSSVACVESWTVRCRTSGTTTRSLFEESSAPQTESTLLLYIASAFVLVLGYWRAPELHHGYAGSSIGKR